MIQSADPLRGRRGDAGGRADARREPPADDPASSAARNRFPAREPGPEECLIRRLAADHLRELRDDGVTLDYVARMYGVSPERMEILFHELFPSRR